jgi:4-hydroxy-3-polyprenylbenzoate decarboxylase
MVPQDLSSFIGVLAGAEELARIRCQVDPILEMAAIVDRTCKAGGYGKALLFENVRGSRIPVAANLFGSPSRVARCFGVADIETLADKLRRDLAASSARPAAKILEELTANHAAAQAADTPWREVDLTAQGLDAIPALKSWPEDGGRYLTLGQVFSADPVTKEANCGIYRIQLVDRHTALLRCHPGSGGAQHIKAWHDRGEAMPVAIALGGPPALTCAAAISLPQSVPEVNFVGYLTGSAVAMAPCEATRLPVPATAEMVIEGRVLPGETMPEGPFGNHTGYYAASSPAPVLRITNVSMKRNAIYPCTVVGRPPMENIHLARTAERLLLPLLQHDCPWVRDVHMPGESIFHRVSLVHVDNEGVPELEAVRGALEASALLRGAKLIVLVDEDPRGLDQREIYWRLINGLMQTRLADGVVTDARSGPGGEKKIVPSEQVRKTLETRWPEYGL